MKVIKKETLFEVKQGDKTHVVKAFDLAHAKRIAARLFQCEVIECEPLKQFPRFDERKIEKNLQELGAGSKGTKVLTHAERMER